MHPWLDVADHVANVTHKLSDLGRSPLIPKTRRRVGQSPGRGLEQPDRLRVAWVIGYVSQAIIRLVPLVRKSNVVEMKSIDGITPDDLMHDRDQVLTHFGVARIDAVVPPKRLSPTLRIVPEPVRVCVEKLPPI